MRSDYKQWLEIKHPKAWANRRSEIKRVESSYGNLEAHFKDNKHLEIINELEYSTQDKRDNKPNPSKINIGVSADLYSNLKSYKRIAESYFKFLQEQNIKTYDGYLKNLNAGIASSLNDTQKARAERLKNAPPKPNKRTVTITVYDRNPDVVAKILLRANGICESCKNPAPFIRRKNNTPFLEVHHIKQLAGGGDDTVENAQALCPNCHKKAHYG